MLVERELLWLPIHRRDQAEYDAKRRVALDERRGEASNLWRRPYEEIPLETRARLEASWGWHCWYPNDVVGFLCVGHDGGKCLGGDLFLRRKHFPRGSEERLGTIGKTTRVMDEVLHYSETTRYQLQDTSNAGYLEACRKVVAEADSTIRRRLKRARVWTPEYGIDCLDLARADLALRVSRDEQIVRFSPLTGAT